MNNVPSLESTLSKDVWNSAHRCAALASQNISSGHYDDGIALLLRAIELKPHFVQAHVNLGLALYRRGNLDDAAASYRRAIEIDPGFALAFFNLGAALKDKGALGDAIEAFQRALTLQPTLHAAWYNLGSAFQAQGRLPEAVEALWRAIALRPDNHKAYSSLIFTMLARQTGLPSDVIDVAKKYDEIVSNLPEMHEIPARRISTDKKISVGILTADLGEHAVSYFLESYLRHYDRDAFEVILYPTLRQSGARFEEQLACADRYRLLHGIDDTQAHQLLLADRLDILIETSGHTRHERLALVARRCAPIQCHYIGSFGTTGVRTVDYFIGDEEVTPPEFDSHYCERVYRLPRSWFAYTPRPVSAPAAQTHRREVVLGCFNSLAKVSSKTLRIWAEALAALPAARLFLKDRLCADDYTRTRILRELSAGGINPSRVTFAPYVSNWAEHMMLYNEMDIALDTTPLSSATTVVEATYMGTPVVAMRGDWMGGRMSSSILKSLGRSEWVAETPKEYVRIVQSLASDKARLLSYKSTLRQEMMRSEVCNGKGLSTALEDAFKAMIASHNAALAA
jgi:predicted O-linked N-acetylglucosamine transferase (SPINDLY family)